MFDAVSARRLKGRADLPPHQRSRSRASANRSTHRVTDRDLGAIRRRRAFPTAVTQAVQRVLQGRLIGPLLRGADPTPRAALFGLMERLPWLSFVPAYFIGVGVRPERAPAFARRGPC